MIMGFLKFLAAAVAGKWALEQQIKANNHLIEEQDLDEQIRISEEKIAKLWKEREISKKKLAELIQKMEKSRRSLERAKKARDKEFGNFYDD
jgi:hypothetical protein